jgi:hypothetical protein
MKTEMKAFGIFMAKSKKRKMMMMMMMMMVPERDFIDFPTSSVLSTCLSVSLNLIISSAGCSSLSQSDHSVCRVLLAVS